MHKKINNININDGIDPSVFKNIGVQVYPSYDCTIDDAPENIDDKETWVSLRNKTDIEWEAALYVLRKTIVQNPKWNVTFKKDNHNNFWARGCYIFTPKIQTPLSFKVEFHTRGQLDKGIPKAPMYLYIGNTNYGCHWLVAEEIDFNVLYKKIIDRFIATSGHRFWIDAQRSKRFDVIEEAQVIKEKELKNINSRWDLYLKFKDNEVLNEIIPSYKNSKFLVALFLKWRELPPLPDFPFLEGSNENAVEVSHYPTLKEIKKENTFNNLPVKIAKYLWELDGHYEMTYANEIMDLSIVTRINKHEVEAKEDIRLGDTITIRKSNKYGGKLKVGLEKNGASIFEKEWFSIIHPDTNMPKFVKLQDDYDWVELSPRDNICDILKIIPDRFTYDKNIILKVLSEVLMSPTMLSIEERYKFYFSRALTNGKVGIEGDVLFLKAKGVNIKMLFPQCLVVSIFGHRIYFNLYCFNPNDFNGNIYTGGNNIGFTVYTKKRYKEEYRESYRLAEKFAMSKRSNGMEDVFTVSCNTKEKTEEPNKYSNKVNNKNIIPQQLTLF